MTLTSSSFSSSSLHTLLPYIARYRWQFGGGLVFLVGTAAIQLVGPWVIKHAIDELSLGVTRSTLGVYAGLLVGVAVAGGGCRFFMRRIIIGVSRQIEYDLRNDFFAHLQRLPLAYYQGQRTGDLMSRATNDLGAVRMMVGPAVMYTGTTSIVFVVAATMMVSISPRLALFALLPLPVVTALVKGFGSAIYHRSEQIQEQLARVSAIVQEALAGVRVVRAYRRETAEMSRFGRANEVYLERSRAVIGLQALFYPSMALCLGLSSLVVLWLGSGLVVAGQMTVGDFVAFNAYLVMLTWPMIAFGWVTNTLQRGLAAWHRMRAVLDATPDVVGPAIHRSLQTRDDVRGKVEFRDLSFSYDGRPVLDAVSATVEPGQVLALIGATGSGKTTLVDLIPRVFDPPRGTVFLDDVDVRDIPLPVLRSAIGYVRQEPFLFSDTIRENVSFGARHDGTDDDVVRRAVEVARLDKDLDDFPLGSETLVGERGITLSGGQKQRAAIARALVGDPRVLILDDVLSAVDTQTEEEVLKRLEDVVRQRATIIVAHRISTVRTADLILVLHHGSVVERGSHDELVARDGVYAGLYRRQRLEEELDQV